MKTVTFQNAQPKFIRNRFSGTMHALYRRVQIEIKLFFQSQYLPKSQSTTLARITHQQYQNYFFVWVCGYVNNTFLSKISLLLKDDKESFFWSEFMH